MVIMIFFNSGVAIIHIECVFAPMAYLFLWLYDEEKSLILSLFSYQVLEADHLGDCYTSHLLHLRSDIASPPLRQDAEGVVSGATLARSDVLHFLHHSADSGGYAEQRDQTDDRKLFRHLVDAMLWCYGEEV